MFAGFPAKTGPAEPIIPLTLAHVHVCVYNDYDGESVI